MITAFGDGIQLTDRFWDCECEENFIHPSTVGNCSVCCAERDMQPDSRVDEVFALLVVDAQIEMKVTES